MFLNIILSAYLKTTFESSSLQSRSFIYNILPLSLNPLLLSVYLPYFNHSWLTFASFFAYSPLTTQKH